MSDVEADLVIGLRKLAKVDSGDDFSIDRDGMRIAVSYSGGSSSSLLLTARYDAVARAETTTTGTREAAYRKSARGGVIRGIRPMSITLREEESADRQAKEEGLSREHQTGDRSFDDRVYIDSPTIDAELLQAVLSEPVRGAVRELVELGFEPIVIDDDRGDVTARTGRFGKLAGVDDAPGRVIGAFAKMLSELPPVSATGAEHPTRSGAPIALAILGGLALMIAGPLGLFGIAGAYDCTEGTGDGEGETFKDGCGHQALLAIGAALVTGFVVMTIVRALARPRVAGRSDSHKQLFYVTAAAFAWSALVALVITALLGYASKV